jgi:peptide/nickel transport system permease protein
VVVPLVAVVLTLLVGVSLGMLAGYLGGRVDAVIARALDVLLSVPPLLVVLVIAASFGTSDVVLVVALVLVSVPKEARVIRGATQDLRTREFVEAAQARGERTRWVLVRELMPNLAPTLLVEVAMRFTFTVIFVATLNFLGLGVQPPNPNWGLMVSEGRDYISQAPLMTLGPVFAIAMLVIAVNLLSDALNTALATRSEAR